MFRPLIMLGGLPGLVVMRVGGKPVKQDEFAATAGDDRPSLRKWLETIFNLVFEARR